MSLMNNKSTLRPFALLALLVGVILVFRQYGPSASEAAGIIPFDPSGTPDPTPLTDLCAQGVNLKDIPALNVTADEFGKFAERFRNGNPLKNLANGTITPEAYGKGLIGFAAPGVVMGVLTLLVFLVFLINQVCRCNLCLKATYTRKEQRCCVLPTLFFSLCLLGATGYVFVATVRTYNGVLQTTCVVQDSYNQLNFGSNYNQSNSSNSNSSIWIGLIPLSDTLYNLGNTILNLPSLIGTKFDNTTWVDQGVDSQAAQLSSLYSLYKGQTLSNPDPKNSTNVTAKIVSSLGPVNIPGTYLGNISLETNLTLGAFKIGVGALRNTTDDVRDTASDISSAVLSAQAKLNGSNNALTSYKHNIQSFSRGLYGTAPVVKDVLVSVFAGIAAILLFSLIITFMITYLKWGKCRIFLHVFWILGIVFSVFCFTLTAVSFPSSIVALEGCDIIGEFIYSPNASTQYINGINPTVLAEINTCLFEDGNLTKFFNLTSTISQLNNMTTSVLSILALQQKFTNLTMTKKLLSDIEATLNFTLQADLPSNVNNSAAMLNYLNSWANSQAPNSYQSSIGACSVSQDNLENTIFYCPAGDTRFEAGDPYNYRFGQPVCIELDLLDPTQAAQRYSAAAYASCDNAAVNTQTGYATIDTLIRTYYTSLFNFQASVTDLYTKMNTSVTNYQANSSALIANISSLFNVIGSFNSSISQVTNAIIGQKGLTNAMNCSFIGIQSRQLYQSVCNQVGANYIQLSIATAAFGFFLFLVSILAYNVAARTSRVLEEYPQHMGYPGQYHQMHAH